MAVGLKATYDVDISEITHSLGLMEKLPRNIIYDIAAEIENIGREELINSFVEAIDRQSEDAFPDEFRAHVLNVVEQAQFESNISGTSFEVFFDFNQLGDRNDLERAFHQGAFLADGTQLDGPYTGQELKNPTGERHIYWEALHRGDTSAPNPKRPCRVPIKPGAWEETKRKYIEIWGNKAPQWLYLQFGQTHWEPKILSYTIIETFQKTFLEIAEKLFVNSVAKAIEAAQQEGISLTHFGARDITTGRFTRFNPS